VIKKKCDKALSSTPFPNQNRSPCLKPQPHAESDLSVHVFGIRRVRERLWVQYVIGKVGETLHPTRSLPSASSSTAKASAAGQSSPASCSYNFFIFADIRI
jgi:hypothetical protein